MKITKVLMLFGGLLVAMSAFATPDDCKSVKGRLTSNVVECDGLLCSEGRFRGNLRGRFTFVASTLVPFGLAVTDPDAPADVFASTGVITIDTKFCRGNLVLKDTSAFAVSSVTGDGDLGFASLETVDGINSTGKCEGATGRVRIQGIFNNGCVDCKYEGLICGVKRSKDEDDD